MTKESVESARRALQNPPGSTRPTPLYWWSGGPLDRATLAYQLDRLAEMPIGGTIVGYAHRADNSIDHDNPEPLSPEWWDLFRWFIDESARRGMTVGMQDYGILGGVLLAAGEATRDTEGGSLRRVSGAAPQQSGGRTLLDVGDARLLHADAVRVGAGDDGVEPVSVRGGCVEWHLPEGEWNLRAIVVDSGKIQGRTSHFDPLHPRAGTEVIQRFYERFTRELGDRVGASFTMFFQDELDLGVWMPMWNSDVGRRLETAGYRLADLHLLWDDEPRADDFRLDYLDTVVQLLQDRFFAPIARWMIEHGLIHLMDQLSRGDLRIGALHYADFIRTMSYFSAPGHDDPNLHGPRNVLGATVSASIAASSGSRIVPVEAFHSSGWDVDPESISREVNALFGLGMTHLVLHGLYSSTEGGTWEWAPPDFHFRQPWWEQSAPLWSAIHQVSAVSRIGVRATDVAVLDPTDALVRSAGRSDAPEIFAKVVTTLAVKGSGVTVITSQDLAAAVVDDGYLCTNEGKYSTLVLPGTDVLRAEADARVAEFAACGGRVVVVGTQHPHTRHAREMVIVAASDESALISAVGSRRVSCSIDDVWIAHRILADGDMFIVVNRGGARRAPLHLPAGLDTTVFRPQAAACTTTQPLSVTGEGAFEVEMGAGELVVILVTTRSAEFAHE